MLVVVVIFIAFAAVVAIFIRLPRFGSKSTGARLAAIKQSANYRDGAFQNQSPTPSLTDGATYSSVMKEFFFMRNKRVMPEHPIPSVKTDLLSLNRNEDVLVWFGHSSYFIQIDGKRILVDPVLSGHASPFSFTTKACPGADRYKPEDIPDIDYLFITHDHWDHLDYKAITALKSKIKQVVTSLGTGAHLERWGYDKNIVKEKDWYNEIVLGDGFTVHTVPGRHFSGRGFKRNQAMWCAFALKTPTMNIFIGGDSGYDKHFAEAGKMYGPFDLVILECGQYSKNWKHIHMLPAEVLQAARDLDAKRLLPVHSSKFALSTHDWDAPLKTLTELNKQEHVNIITPMIGEQVNLKDTAQKFSAWWEG